jgi:hypothetical protein
MTLRACHAHPTLASGQLKGPLNRELPDDDDNCRTSIEVLAPETLNNDIYSI